MNSTRSLAAGILMLSFSFVLTNYAQTLNSATAPSAGDQAGDQTVTMNPFNVSTAGDRGYATANSVGANMVNTPILDTSFSIVAFNQQFMQDVLATDPTVAAQWA